MECKTSPHHPRAWVAGRLVTRSLHRLSLAFWRPGWRPGNEAGGLGTRLGVWKQGWGLGMRLGVWEQDWGAGNKAGDWE